MALQQQIKTKAEWVTFFLEADIPQVESDTYHHIYQHHITELTMSRTDNQTLLDIRINTLGDCLSALQHIKSKSNSSTVTTKLIAPATAKTPTLPSNITHAQKI